MEGHSSDGIEPATLLPLAPTQFAVNSGTTGAQSPIDPDHVNPIKAASSKPADESSALPNLNHRRRTSSSSEAGRLQRRDSLADMWCLHVFALLYAANLYGDCVEGDSVCEYEAYTKKDSRCHDTYIRVILSPVEQFNMHNSFLKDLQPFWLAYTL